MKVGSLGFMGLSLSRYLRLQYALGETTERAEPKAQSVILLWSNGGPSQVDTWDPKSNSSFRPISTNVPGIQISELLPRMSKHMDKVAIIRSMKTEENNHGLAHHYFHTGHRPSPAMNFPSLGSMISHELAQRNGIPPHVMVPSIGPSFIRYFQAHMLGARYDPMELPDPSQKDFEVPDLSLPQSLSVERLGSRRETARLVDSLYREQVRSAEHSDLDEFQRQALEMILSPAVREAFDLSREPEALKDAYGRDKVGQSALIARRLVEAGSRFVTVVDYKRKETGRDWDTHADNDEQHRDILVPGTDRVLSTLLADLDQRGLLSSTIVIATGEFGRTPDINPAGGRDHWNHCWSFGIGWRRNSRRSGGRRKRRTRSLCEGSRGHDWGPFRHSLQGPGNRLDQGDHAPDRPSPENRQLHRRHHGSADQRAHLKEFELSAVKNQVRQSRERLDLSAVSAQVPRRELDNSITSPKLRPERSTNRSRGT